MNYRKLIHNSIPVSEIGLGAWQLGQNSGWKSVSEMEAIKLVHQSLELGVNFFDTAPNYGHGTSEERLGKALRETNRDKIVINTKFGHTHTGILNYDSSYIRESLEGSLKRLQLDYVDSLIIHSPPSEILDGTKNDHYNVLEKLVEEGKIKAYGASIDTYADMKTLMDTTPSKVMELFFNIFHQEVLQGFEQAQSNDVGIIVKIPLDSGWLTGKYDAHSRFTDIRSRWSDSDIKTRAGLVDKLTDIVGVETPLAQTSLAYCLAYDAISTVIPGSVNMEQLKGNVKSSNTSISSNLKEELENFYQNEVKKLQLPW